MPIARFAFRLPTCPRRRRFRKVADPTSESAGRPEEAPTDSSPWALPRDVCSLDHLAPLAFRSQPRSRKAGARRRTRAEQNTQRWDSRRKAELSGPRGPVPREVVVGCLQRPGGAGAQILRARLPAEKSSWQAGADRGRCAPEGPKGRPRGGRRGASGWQLAKRYCGEIGGQGLRGDLDTEMPTGLPTGSPGRAERPPDEAKAVPADDPTAAAATTAAAASWRCGQAGQTRFARL